jgi:hypothetical protein
LSLVPRALIFCMVFGLSAGQAPVPPAITIEAVYANGTVATAPIQNGRFTVIAAQPGPACTLRALDAHGSLLAVQPVSVAPGLGCP